ncbi:hypothetical protein [Vibrio bathopelagicus]
MQRKHLVVLELSTINHYSLLENWIEIAKINSWDITIVTLKEIRANLNSELVNDIECVLVEKRDVMRQLVKVKSLFKKDFNNLVLFTSIQSNFFSFFIFSLLRIRFGITIHNVNAWLGKANSTSLKFRIKTYFRKVIYKKASFLVVNSLNMKNYYDKESNNEKPICVMPFKLFKPSNLPIECTNVKLKIVYPGMVSSSRKRYDNFIRLARNMPDAEFVLMGRVESTDEDNKIIEEASKLSNITCINGYVPRDIFDKEIKEADYIFGDIRVDFLDFEYIEKYGVTKDSGLSYFSIEFGKPILVNSDFSNLSGLELFTQYFDSSAISNYKIDKNTLDYDKKCSLLNRFSASSISENVSGILW